MRLSGLLQRYLSMMTKTALTEPERASLVEVGKGCGHGAILPAHSAKLLALGLIYRLLGEDRITKAGRAAIQQF